MIGGVTFHKGGEELLSYINHIGTVYVPPNQVGFLHCFGLKTGIHFAHFGLELGMVFGKLQSV